MKAIFGEGRGPQNEPEMEHLSQIVDVLNERFGLNLNEQDQLLFDQFEETWVADPEVAAQARNNTIENFRLVFDRRFLGTVVGRMDENEAIFKRILATMRSSVTRWRSSTCGRYTRGSAKEIPQDGSLRIEGVWLPALTGKAHRSQGTACSISSTSGTGT